MKITVLLIFIGMQVSFAAPHTPEKNSQNQIEVLQAQATLQFHTKQYKSCSDSIKKILALDAKNAQAMELLALSLKAVNQEDDAAKVYSRLLKVVPEKEKQAAYHFELATIRYKQKKQKEAKPHFEFASRNKFNPGMSNFFLGIIDFGEKDWRNAKNHFAAALSYHDSRTVYPISRFYLASTYAQLGKNDAAVHNFFEADRSVENASVEERANPLNTEIRRNALKEIKALDKAQRFATISLMAQFDDNVQTNPTEVATPVPPSDRSSAKMVFSGAVGYQSSPTHKFQFTPSYRLYTNYNFNERTRDFNFISHTPSLYVLYRPYARLAAGLKAEGTYSQKNLLTVDDSRSALKYKSFSMSGDIGPIVKFEVTPRIQLALETTWRPKKFYLDPATGDSRRTGHGIFTRVSGEFISEYTWLNPLGFISHEWDNPEGKTFRMHAFGIGVSNSVQFFQKLNTTLGFDLTSTDYFETRSPERDDLLMNVRLSGSYPLTSRISTMADLTYTSNDSTIVSTFKYNRFVASLGASYSF